MLALLTTRPTAFGMRLAYAAGGALLATSAHFAGFLSQIPSEFASIVAVSMATAFSTNFLFYVVASLVLARILATFSGMAWLLGPLIGRFLLPGKRTRKIRAFAELLHQERGLFYVSLAVLFTTTFCEVYLDLASGKLALATAIAVLFAPYHVFHRSRFTFTKIKSRIERSRFYRSALVTSIGIAVGLVIAGAYGAGMLRYKKLWNSRPVAVQEPRFFGTFNVLLSTGRDTLLVKHQGLAHRHVLVTPNAIYYELVLNTELAPASAFRLPLVPADTSRLEANTA